MKYYKSTLLMIVTLGFVFSVSVNEERALNVAQNFYFSKNNPEFA